MKAVGYFRQPAGQRGGNSLSRQNRGFLDYCESQGYEVAATFSEDSEGEAAPAFAQLVEYLKRPEKGFVVVVAQAPAVLGDDANTAAARYLQIESLGGRVQFTSREGDALILTKGVAIEGTAVLAREASATLERLGVPPPAVERARRYIFEPGISVVRDALTACDALSTAGGVHAMHDPTEGGLATALYEMAEASGLGVTVRAEAITVLPETQAICAAASLEPLGLLASGALLIAVAQRDCETVLAALRDGGIEASRIGSMAKREVGVIMGEHAGSLKVPRFARDEVARFLASQ